MNKIDKKIVKTSVKSLENLSETEHKNLQNCLEKLEREELLYGVTYKLKVPKYEQSFYMTINEQNGRPFEVFIESKAQELFPFLRVISLTLSAFLRTGLDIDFLLQEYKEIQDPTGGFRAKVKFLGDKSQYYSSLIALFAEVLDFHITKLKEIHQ